MLKLESQALFVKIALLIVLASGLLLIRYNLSQAPHAQSHQAHAEQDSIDEYAYHATMIRFNEQGTLQQKLNITSWVHHHESGMAYFEAPDLTLYSLESTWHVKSQKGHTHQAHLGDKLNEIELIHAVEINHTAVTRSSWQMSTEHLRFFLNENRSRTEDPVTITQPNLTIEAVGADADLEKGTIHLNQKVKTTYLREHA